MASFLLPLSRGESLTPLLKKKAPCPNFRFILILNLSVFTFCLYIRMPHFSSPPTPSHFCHLLGQVRAEVGPELVGEAGDREAEGGGGGECGWNLHTTRVRQTTVRNTGQLQNWGIWRRIRD